MMPGGLAVTACGLNDQGWVLKAELKNSTFGELRPFVQTKAASRIDALLGIVYNRHGFMVLAPRDDDGKSAGSRHRPQSVLSFYNVKNWNLLMSLPIELHNVTGLAYSPKSGRLYAVDFAWDDPTQGGLYRLDAAAIDGQSGVKAVKMTVLDKPCAMSFTSDNVLYVTAFGSIPKEPKTDKLPKPGKLLRISGEL